MAIEFENVDFERTVLALLLQASVRKQLRHDLGLLSEDSFSDGTCLRIFKVLRDYKGKKRPARKLVVAKATFSLEPTKVVAVKELARKIYSQAKGLGEAELEAFSLYCEELGRLAKSRAVWARLDSAIRCIETGDADGVKREMRLAAQEFEHDEISVFRTDPVADFRHHRGVLREKIRHPEMFAGIPTGIGLYDASTGGLFPKELIIMLACAKIGKSTFLLEVGHNAAMGGKFVLHATIEMDRYKAANRFFSRRSKIPFAHFRDPLGQDPEHPNLSDDEFAQLRKSILKLKRAGGVYAISEFKGRVCTVPAIEAEVRRAEERYGRRVDVVTVDYLNDMMPVERHREDSEWQALGTISWDLAQLAKNFVHFDDPPDRPTGLAIVTANQAKTESAYKKILTQKDFAYSPRPREHANAVCFMTQTRQNEAEGTLNFGWVAARDFDKARYGLLYPDFTVMRIDSPQMKRRVRGERKMTGAF